MDKDRVKSIGISSDKRDMDKEDFRVSSPAEVFWNSPTTSASQLNSGVADSSYCNIRNAPLSICCHLAGQIQKASWPREFLILWSNHEWKPDPCPYTLWGRITIHIKLILLGNTNCLSGTDCSMSGRFLQDNEF